VQEYIGVEMLRPVKRFFLGCLTVILIAACSPQVNPTQASPITPTNIITATSIPLATVIEPSATSEPVLPASTVNPLTGLEVQDPSLLDYPAALVSISHFPPAARPQAGLSFAPFVFEIYITEGATRFLTTFYGQLPEPQPVLNGNCDVRTTPFKQTDLVLGNHIWWDANQNNIEDPWEQGVGGVCVNLYDANNNLLQQTTTDSNGYYAFNVLAGMYSIEVVKPDDMEFDQENVGEEDQDSDVDQATGRSEAVDVQSNLLNLDAGLIPSESLVPTSDLAIPYVGPVRSGRLIYRFIADFFPGSCLIFAYASPEVLVELPKCSFVDHILQGGGYMLGIDEMKKLVEARKNIGTRKYYVSNAFANDVPDGGKPATRLDEFIAWLNQSAWDYDAASQSYWRYVDTADPDFAGVLHAEVDRLTKRQLQFENVIVLFAKHDVIKPTNLDIHLDQGLVGKAILFRDGQMFDVRWSTKLTDDETKNGARKPIQFYYPDSDTLFPLKPGHTWVIIVTPQSQVLDQSNGVWKLIYTQPPGAK